MENLEEPAEIGQENQAIIGLYLLFARLLNEELNPELREVLLQPAVLDILSMAEEGVLKYLEGDWDESDYEAASVLFCDTFILPERSIQPRAAAWLGDGNAVSADGIHAVVESFIEQRKLSLPEEFARLPFDHASVLFFLAATLREIQCDQAAEFEEATLGSWVHTFGSALHESESPLYRSLGRLIEAA